MAQPALTLAPFTWPPLTLTLARSFVTLCAAARVQPQVPMTAELPHAQPAPRSTRLDEALKDNAGKIIPAQWVVRTDQVHAEACAAFERGDALLMIGAQTSATSNFDLEYRQPAHPLGQGQVIGIQPLGRAVDASGQVHPQVCSCDKPWDPAAQPLRSDEIQVCRDCEGLDRHAVRLGAGVTFSQVNQGIAEVFSGDDHFEYVVPIDLTTVDIAQAGGVYATGAQGPSRFRISDVARSATLSDGQQLRHLSTPEDIEAHQGLWGMTGGVVELELRVYRRPKHRFGFFIPLTHNAGGNWIEQVAAVLALLREATELRLEDGEIRSGWSSGLLDGAEVVARETLELVAFTQLPAGNNRLTAQKILALMQERQRSGVARSRSDFGIYMTGSSRHAELDGFLEDVDSPLAKLLEYAEHRERFLHTDGIKTIIDDPRAFEEMRLLRESFADIARQHAKHRAPGQGKPFSESTDINCFIDPESARHMDMHELREQFRLILQPYYVYEMRIRDLTEVAAQNGVQLTMSRYGHLNPRSTNLHTRVTLHGPEDSLAVLVYQQVVQRARDNLLAVLRDLSVRFPTIRVEGGEKGKMTAEALELMSPAQRERVAQLLASADPRWQPHLKGQWARLVRAERQKLPG